MTLSKQLFLKDEELCKSWSAVAKQRFFEQALTSTRASLAESSHWTEAQWSAVNAFIDELRTIGDKEEDLIPLRAPLMVHDLDVKPRKKKE